MAPASPYVTTRAVKFEGEIHPEGSTLELSPKDAAPLIACGAVGNPDQTEGKVTEPEKTESTGPDPAASKALADREEAVGLREEAVKKAEGNLKDREEAVEKREVTATNVAEKVKTKIEETADQMEAVKNREEALKRKEWLLSDPDFREARLKAAIKKVVDGKVPADLMTSGAPKTEAIEREAGETISAKERDKWFAELYPDKAGK